MYTYLTSKNKHSVLVEELYVSVPSDKVVNTSLRKLTHDASYATARNKFEYPTITDYTNVDAYLQKHANEKLAVESKSTNGNIGLIFGANGAFPLDRDFAIAKTMKEGDFSVRDLIYTDNIHNEFVSSDEFFEDWRKAIAKPNSNASKLWFAQFETYRTGLKRYDEIRNDPVFNILPLPKEEQKLAEKWMELINQYVHDSSKDGVIPEKALLKDLSVPNFYTEYRIGRTLNALKEQIPTFVWTFPWVSQYNSYILLENIPHTYSLGSFVYEGEQYSTRYEVALILLRILHALKLANKHCNFHHNDLHQDNVLIRATPNTTATLHGYTFLTNFTPYIIDYGYSTIHNDTIPSYQVTNSRGSITGDMGLLLESCREVLPEVRPLLRQISSDQEKQKLQHPEYFDYTLKDSKGKIYKNYNVYAELDKAYVDKMTEMLLNIVRTDTVTYPMTVKPSIRVEEKVISAGLLKYKFVPAGNYVVGTKYNDTTPIVRNVNHSLYALRGSIPINIAESMGDFTQLIKREKVNAIAFKDKIAFKREYVQEVEESVFSYILLRTIDKILVHSPKEDAVKMLSEFFNICRLYEDVDMNILTFYEISCLIIAILMVKYKNYDLYDKTLINEKYMTKLCNLVEKKNVVLIDKKKTKLIKDHIFNPNYTILSKRQETMLKSVVEKKLSVQKAYSLYFADKI